MEVEGKFSSKSTLDQHLKQLPQLQHKADIRPLRMLEHTDWRSVEWVMNGFTTKKMERRRYIKLPGGCLSD